MEQLVLPPASTQPSARASILYEQVAGSPQMHALLDDVVAQAQVSRAAGTVQVVAKAMPPPGSRG